jgi:hypothetical protein
MKPLQFTTRLCAFLAVILLSQSCSPPKPGTWANNDIEKGKRDDLHALNKILFAGLQANSDNTLQEIWSKDMINDPSRLRTTEVISNRMKEGKYEILDEFYIVNDQKGPHSIGMNTRGLNSYTLNYDAQTREMYIVFFVPKTNANRWLVSAVFCKFDYGWKLDKLDVNPYISNGKTAPELYDYAKKEYAKHYLVNALNAMAEAKTCIQPFAGWQYPDAGKMDEFYANLGNALNAHYVFPYTITQVATQPRIFNISEQTTPEGVFPVVAYKSSIKLKDTTALKKENESVKKVIGKLMPGIDKDKNYVFYYIYNQWPRYDESVDRYEIDDKLK